MTCKLLRNDARVQNVYEGLKSFYRSSDTDKTAMLTGLAFGLATGRTEGKKLNALGDTSVHEDKFANS